MNIHDLGLIIAMCSVQPESMVTALVEKEQISSQKAVEIVEKACGHALINLKDYELYIRAYTNEGDEI